MPIIQSRATAAVAETAADVASEEERLALTGAGSSAAAGGSSGDEAAAAAPSAAAAASFDAQCGVAGTKAQRELRAAKMMATAALLVALLCVGPLAVLASRLQVLSAAAAAAAVPSEGDAIVGLAEETSQGHSQGWHRTYLKSRVRRGVGLDTEEVKVLPAGSLVWVAEAQGRRARISRPVEGWMSLRSADGVEILRPDMTYDAPLNSTSLVAMLRSRRLREDNRKLQEVAANMTKKQRELMDAIKTLRKNDAVRKVEAGAAKVAAVAKAKAPEFGRKITHSAEEVFKRTVKRERAEQAERFLKKTFH
mmetsp:Transcript_107632/g.278646  ORF Transcript_107632/g.278646 Transcript_107632/m.278646 type:complete len:308 (+) Transcript_107632:73-996(+)